MPNWFATCVVTSRLTAGIESSSERHFASLSPPLPVNLDIAIIVILFPFDGVNLMLSYFAEAGNQRTCHAFQGFPGDKMAVKAWESAPTSRNVKTS
jgi:hypothetical protein